MSNMENKKKYFLKNFKLVEIENKYVIKIIFKQNEASLIKSVYYWLRRE